MPLPMATADPPKPARTTAAATPPKAPVVGEASEARLPEPGASDSCFRSPVFRFALVSAIGASVDSSFFYPKVKGELEQDIRKIGFRSLTILRPSMIGGARGEFRLTESIALALSRVLAPVLPRRFHVNPAPIIAQALVDAILAGEPGCHFRFSDSLVAAGKHLQDGRGVV